MEMRNKIKIERIISFLCISVILSIYTILLRFSSPNPKMSFIVISYNQERYIEECLNSILEQNIDKEIIITDDYSTDKTFEILQAYQKKYPEIKLFRNKQNLGTIINRYYGLSNAKGDYALFVDADDKLIPQKMPEIYQFAVQNHADILEFSADTDGSEKLKKYLSKNNNIIENDILKNYSEKKISNELWNKLIAKNVYSSALKKMNKYTKQPNYSDVVYFLYNFFLNSQNVVQSDIVGYFYYAHRGMTSHLAPIEILKNYCGFNITKKELEKTYGHIDTLEKTYDIVCKQAVSLFIKLERIDQDRYRPELYKLMSDEKIEEYIKLMQN